MTDTPPASGPTDPDDRPPPPKKEKANEQNSQNQRPDESKGSATASEGDQTTPSNK